MCASATLLARPSHSRLSHASGLEIDLPPADSATSEHQKTTPSPSSRGEVIRLVSPTLTAKRASPSTEAKHQRPAKATKVDPQADIPLPPPGPAKSGEAFEVTLLAPTTGPLQQGSLVEFLFQLRNPSQDVLILKSLSTLNDEDLPVRFAISGYGTITFDEARDAYIYETMAQQATSRIFNHGVMLPGEARRIPITIRVLEPNQTIKLSFLRLSMKDFRRIAFAPIEGGAGRSIIYQHLQNLPEDYIVPRDTVDGPILDRPFLLWEDLLPGKVSLHEQLYTRETPLKEVRLSAADAIEIAGFKGELTYWEWAGGWIVISGRHAVMVTPEQKRPLPPVDRRLFRDIDSGKQRIRVKLTAGGEVFKTRFMTRGGDGVYTFGDFIEVPRERLWEFFDLARGENFQISREAYLFDAYYYVLSPRP